MNEESARFSCMNDVTLVLKGILIYVRVSPQLNIMNNSAMKICLQGNETMTVCHNY